MREDQLQIGETVQHAAEDQGADADRAVVDILDDDVEAEVVGPGSGHRLGGMDKDWHIQFHRRSPKVVQRGLAQIDAIDARSNYTTQSPRFLYAIFQLGGGPVSVLEGDRGQHGQALRVFLHLFP